MEFYRLMTCKKKTRPKFNDKNAVRKLYNNSTRHYKAVKKVSGTKEYDLIKLDNDNNLLTKSASKLDLDNKKKYYDPKNSYVYFIYEKKETAKNKKESETEKKLDEVLNKLQDLTIRMDAIEEMSKKTSHLDANTNSIKEQLELLTKTLNKEVQIKN